MGSSNDAAAAVESRNDFGGRQAQLSGSPVVADSAGIAAGQQATPYGQGNVPGHGSGQTGGNFMQPQTEGSSMQSQAGGSYVQPQAEGGYMQPQAPGGGNYMQ